MPILKPTIVIVADSGSSAKLFYADNDEFRHIGDVFVDITFEQSGAHADLHSKPWEEANRLKFYHQLNEELQTRLQNKEAEELVVCVPHEGKNELEEHLTTDVETRIVKIVPKNLHKLSTTELREYLENA
ncbi:MAG: host attachment protein [Patescibacteria group bacterium]